MPLYNGEHFRKRQPPEDLDPDEEVFFSPITLEIFRDYDDYFERTILVNSVTWYCSICGRGPSSFADAAACERVDRRELSAFCPSLAAGLLYIIHHSKRQRLGELVELLCNFAASRFFVGESVLYSRLNPRERFDGCVKRVLVASSVKTISATERERPLEKSLNDTEGTVEVVAPTDVLYQIEDNSSSTSIDKKLLLLPYNQLFRRAKHAVTRDRVRFFIRHTCELKDGYFSPKASVMLHYRIHPHGSLLWADLFLPPEPNWSRFVYNVLVGQSAQKHTIAPSRIQQSLSKFDTKFPNPREPGIQTTRSSLIFDALRSPSSVLSADHVEELEATDTTFRSISAQVALKGRLESSASVPTWNNERLERLELEREWTLVRRREDLELPDLVPLPDFPKFPTRIPPSILGSALQLFEFFHIFGDHLSLPNHSLGSFSSLSWTVLENALVDSNPGGPLAELFISMLCAIRKLDADANSRPLPPSVVCSTYASAAAVAACETGASFSTHYFGHATEFSSVYEDLISGSAGTIAHVLRLAAIATRFNELVGIPSPASSQAAGKAAAIAVSAIADDSEAGSREEEVSITTGGTRKCNIRAATMAIHAGAASLCPLDRAGLSKALWLHIACGAARYGGFRGARPLDDPAMMFAREHPQLLEKLNTVSVYELEVHEKLLFLTVLMDQLLLYPHLRDLYERNFERQRTLRTKLRNLQGSHFTSSCVGDTLSKPESAGTAVGKTHALNLNKCSLNGKDDQHSETTGLIGTDTKFEHNSSPSPGLDLAKCEQLDSKNDEEFLRKEILEASRGCCLFPLGQDRFYRRYWVVMSLPAVLIEDCGWHADLPPSPRKLINRQISSVLPAVAEDLGISSPAAAAHRLREFIAGLPCSEPATRESITFKLSAKLPSSLASNLDYLRMLVRPERIQPNDRQHHNQCPAFRQCEQRNSHFAGHNSTDTVWFIVKPLGFPDLPQSNQLTSSGKQVMSVNEGSTKPEDNPDNKLDTRGTQPPPYSSDKCAVMDQAVWTIDCLEASLNVRGLREARLRKTIGQLRPLLIQTIASYSDVKFSSMHDTTIEHSTASKPKCNAQEILLGWLEIALRRLARRLHKTSAVRSVFVASSSDLSSSLGSQSTPEPNLPTVSKSVGCRFLYTGDLPPDERLKTLSQVLFDLGQAVGPGSVTGPISDENKTLRGVSNSTASDPREISYWQPPSQSTLMTGWQRWCSHVQAARSCSELHLLARALERGIRRSPVKRKPLRVTEPNEKGFALKIRCTACRLPPDPVATSPSSAFPTGQQSRLPANCPAGILHVPLATCAGCYAPFHLDCLMNSDARSQRSRQHASHYTPLVNTAGPTKTDLHMTGYCSMFNSLSSVTAARIETTTGSSYLCNSCLRVIGRSPYPNSDAVSPAQLTGDEDSDTVSINSGLSSDDQSDTPLKTVPRGRTSPSMIVVKRERNPARRSLRLPDNETQTDYPVRRDSDIQTRSNHSKRPCSSQRPVPSSDRFRISTRSSSRSISKASNERRPLLKRSRLSRVSQSTKKPKSFIENAKPQIMERLLDESFVLNGHGAHFDDEVVINLPFLKKATIVLSPCDSPLEILCPRSRSRLRAHSPHLMEDTESENCDSRESTDRPGQPILDQHFVEQLFADLCNSRSARPLLRCGLGRTLASADELTNDLVGGYSKSTRTGIRHSTRIRQPSSTSLVGLRSHSSGLYAWDLNSLQELLTHKSLPGGPAEAVDQLRLLIKHWLRVNRPGSRLYQCANDISRQLEEKLTQMDRNYFRRVSQTEPLKCSR